MRTILLALVLLALATPALATDGVLEINQTCAVQTGCFLGDTAGFPVTISTSGSYRLAGNLTVPDQNTTGIEIVTNDVAIDLNEFAIVRSGCVAANPACILGGSGTGVNGTLPTARLGISVRNGSVTGMGNYGVLLGDQAEVTNVRARWNSNSGIVVRSGSTATGNVTYGNVGAGIACGGSGTVIADNAVYDNGVTGILASVGTGHIIKDNTVHDHNGRGISAGEASTISGNSVYHNVSDGIYCGDGCSILGNTSSNNGGGPDPTMTDGIECGAGCIVRTNSVRGNAGYGLKLGPGSAYSANVLTLNGTGTVTGGIAAATPAQNYCDGVNTPQCP